MPGLTFLNSIFLAGLAAAALPVLIHLFSRRRAKDVPFPSLEYLREISLKKVRRMRLRQLLLLALRVLILAFFALAMGRPALRGSAGVVTRGSSTLAIVLDNSYSLDAADPRLTRETPPDLPGASGGAGSADGGVEVFTRGPQPAGSAPSVDETGTLFAAAKARALEVLDLMQEGDRGVLALSGRPVELPFQTSVTDAGLLRQEVRRAALSADRSDLPAALEQVLPLLASARTMNKELFLISDFQKKDLEEWIRAGGEDGGGPALKAAPDAAARRSSAGGDTTRSTGAIRIPDGVRVYLIPVSARDGENVCVERLRYDATAGTRGAGRIVATVWNQGDSPVTDRVVRALGGVHGVTRPLADALFSLPSRGRGDVSLDLSALPGDGEIEVRLGSDPLEWDNSAYLVTHDPGVRKVLIVGEPGEAAGVGGEGAGSPAGISSDGGAIRAIGSNPEASTRFLRTALDPGGKSEFYQVRVAEPSALNDPASWNADVVLLTNVGRLTDAAVENLGRFRSRGGGILIGLGDHVDPRYYNTQILSKLSSIELLNVVHEGGDGAFRSLRPTVLAHPIFAGFPIGPGEELGSARFRTLMSCRTGSSARVVAEFGRDLPAVIEEDGLLLFTSSLDGQWNDFVTSASFLPLLHRMVRYLAGRGGSEGGALRVGGRLETLVPEDAASGAVTCVDPTGVHSPVEAAPIESMVRLRSQPSPLPGVYRFVDGSGKTLSSFAVNLDPAESDLRVAGPEMESRLLGRGALRLEPGQPITRELLEGRYGRELWRPLLILVLVLLTAESLLGRGRLLG